MFVDVFKYEKGNPHCIGPVFAVFAVPALLLDLIPPLRFDGLG